MSNKIFDNTIKENPNLGFYNKEQNNKYAHGKIVKNYGSKFYFD